MLVCVVAFALRFGLALAMPNIHRPDEIFQNIEPAYRMWSGYGTVTWEWRVGIRSPVFPGFLAGLIGVVRILGFGPTAYMAVIAAVMSLISTAVVAMAFRIGRQRHGLSGALICGVLCAVWPDLIYFGSKPLAEVVAGNLLTLATGFVLCPGRAGSAKDPRSATMLVIGLLLGFSFALRFQLAPAILLIAAWSCLRNGRRDLRRDLGHRLPWLVAGGSVPLLIMGAADWRFWGSPFHSVWANFAINAMQHVSREYGVKSGRWYLARLVANWGGSVVPLGVAMVLGARRAPLLAAVAILVILSHSLIAHKEISFIYAALPSMLILSGLGTCRFIEPSWRLPVLPLRLKPFHAALAFWIATSTATALSTGFLAMWKAHRANLLADAILSHDNSLCGLGLRWPVEWGWTGSDALLGKHIPIYAFISAAGVARVAPAINAAIGGRNVADGLPGFAVMQCWPSVDGSGDVCLAHAGPGKRCTPDPGFELNAVANLGRLGTNVGTDKR